MFHARQSERNAEENASCDGSLTRGARAVAYYAISRSRKIVSQYVLLRKNLVRFAHNNRKSRIRVEDAYVAGGRVCCVRQRRVTRPKEADNTRRRSAQRSENRICIRGNAFDGRERVIHMQKHALALKILAAPYRGSRARASIDYKRASGSPFAICIKNAANGRGNRLACRSQSVLDFQSGPD